MKLQAQDGPASGASPHAGPSAIDASTGAFELSIREQSLIAIGGACRAGELCVTGAVCHGATPTAAGTCVAHD